MSNESNNIIDTDLINSLILIAYEEVESILSKEKYNSISKATFYLSAYLRDIETTNSKILTEILKNTEFVQYYVRLCCIKYGFKINLDGYNQLTSFKEVHSLYTEINKVIESFNSQNYLDNLPQTTVQLVKNTINVQEVWSKDKLVINGLNYDSSKEYKKIMQNLFTNSS